LYGCESWSPILREKHRLKVCEHGAEENMWTYEGVTIGFSNKVLHHGVSKYEGESGRKLKKTA
jgi:hypothetical protein